MQKPVKLVAFDLDDTLTFDIHSVMFLCILNDRYDELMKIEKKEAAGEYHWIEADYHKAALLEGLAVSEIAKGFDSILKPIGNIAPTIDALHRQGIQSIVVTAGPIQVAQAIAEKWGLDGYYGSLYEVKDGLFTGKITRHVGDTGKVACVEDYCQNHDIEPGSCIAVGDGLTDVPMFEYCGQSIAINHGPAVLGKATHYIKTMDLRDILPFIID